MPIVNVVNKSALEGALRIEAEYYTPENMAIADHLRRLDSKRLALFCAFIRKGIFDLPPSKYTAIGVPLIRTTEIRTPIADLSVTARIPSEVHARHSSTELTSGDIVFTKIGANIGDVALLPEEESVYNFSQNVAGAKILRDRIDSKYLACFLSTRYGRTQIRRIQMLSGQGKLELVDIKDLLVFVPTEKLRSDITALYSKAEEQLIKAKRDYQQAEQLLLSELKLLDWKPEPRLTFIRGYSEVLRNQRADAEYFQLKYDELIAAISPFAPSKLGSMVTPLASAATINDEVVYRYIEIGDVNTNTGEVEFTERHGKDLPANARIRVTGGELIVSKVRPTRGAVGIVPSECEHNGVCSGAFSVYGVDTPKREYLQLVLRSPVGKLQLEKPSKGTSYPTIEDADVRELLIPTLPDPIVDNTGRLVQESFAARREARATLTEARNALENAIEACQTKTDLAEG